MINSNSEHSRLLETVTPLVDETIAKLSQTKFREDPIGGLKYSRATSIISSAYKRHAHILERSILERLKECSRFQVWQEANFKLSPDSFRQLRTHDIIEKCMTIKLPYGEEDRAIPIDIVLFDKESGILRSYNVKRGNGSYDARKKKVILGELLRTNMLLHSYGKKIGIDAQKAESRIIFYYGVRSIPPPLSITGEELDSHVGFSVVEAVEVVNEYFRKKLYRLIEHG